MCPYYRVLIRTQSVDAKFQQQRTSGLEEETEPSHVMSRLWRGAAENGLRRDDALQNSTQTKLISNVGKDPVNTLYLNAEKFTTFENLKAKFTKTPPFMLAYHPHEQRRTTSDVISAGTSHALVGQMYTFFLKPYWPF